MELWQITKSTESGSALVGYYELQQSRDTFSLLQNQQYPIIVLKQTTHIYLSYISQKLPTGHSVADILVTISGLYPYTSLLHSVLYVIGISLLHLVVYILITSLLHSKVYALVTSLLHSRVYILDTFKGLHPYYIQWFISLLNPCYIKCLISLLHHFYNQYGFISLLQPCCIQWFISLLHPC